MLHVPTCKTETLTQFHKPPLRSSWLPTPTCIPYSSTTASDSLCLRQVTPLLPSTHKLQTYTSPDFPASGRGSASVSLFLIFSPFPFLFFFFFPFSPFLPFTISPRRCIPRAGAEPVSPPASPRPPPPYGEREPPPHPGTSGGGWRSGTGGGGLRFTVVMELIR